mgnify:FL=1
MKIICRKDLGSLIPVDEAGEEALRQIKNGDLIHIEVKRTRNINHHRKYWAMVHLVFANQSRYETPQLLHSALKISSGHYDMLTMPNGHVYKIPKSTSFEKMDQIEFSQYYDRVCDLVAKYFLPGVDVESLKSEIEEIIGARAA